MAENLEIINDYIQSEIKDKRPAKVSAEQIRTALLYITGFIGDIKPVIEEDITANVEVGGIKVGDNIATGTNLTAFVKALTHKVYYPSITAPSFALANNVGALREIGASLNVTLTFTFNRGSIQSTWSNTSQGSRAGAATGYTFIKANDTVYVTQAGNAYIVNNHAVIKGLNTFKAKVAYGVGIQPKDSDGGDFDAPLPAGESAILTTTFEGVYAIYATTTAIATMTKQSLYSMLTGNNIEITFVGESGGNKQAFSIPAEWLAARPLTSVQYFNAVSNSYDLANKSGDFTITDEVHGGAPYKKFTNNSPDRGALKIRLIF